MSKAKVSKFLIAKVYSETQKRYFYLSDHKDYISWVFDKNKAKRFNTIEGIMMFIENSKAVDSGLYEIETVLEKKLEKNPNYIL